MWNGIVLFQYMEQTETVLEISLMLNCFLLQDSFLCCSSGNYGMPGVGLRSWKGSLCFLWCWVWVDPCGLVKLRCVPWDRWGAVPWTPHAGIPWWQWEMSVVHREFFQPHMPYASLNSKTWGNVHSRKVRILFSFRNIMVIPPQSFIWQDLQIPVCRYLKFLFHF